MKVSLTVLVLIIISGVSFMGCSSLGTKPNKIVKKGFEVSDNYDSEKGIFVNRRQKKLDEMREKMDSWELIKKWWNKPDDLNPSSEIPQVKPSVAEFLQPSDDLKVIWFGHSTFLLNMDGKIVLVDPVFSEYAAPVNLMVKRFQAPALSLEELPEVDYILISHDHYDHLDQKSIKFFKDKKTKFITPLGVGSHIVGWGIDKKRIIEKDWWQSEEFSGIKFIATPAQHFSGRSGFDNNHTLWASWVIQSKNHNIYFSGDTGYDVHFKDIGEKYGPFDIAFIESGQYNKRWKEVHMLPEEGVQAFHDLKAKKYFPVHWGMFELALHRWNEPAELISKMAQEQNFEFVTPMIGEILNVNQENKFYKWWQYEKSKEVKKDKISQITMENLIPTN